MMMTRAWVLMALAISTICCRPVERSATGVVVGGLQAGLASNHDDRIPGLVTASKAAIGTTRLLLFPHPGIEGSAPLEIERGSRRETLEARLIAGEAHLLDVEHKARARKSWIAHATNVGLNGIGAGVIVGIGNPSDAILNAGVGILFGEIMLWTSPWRGEEDLRDYRSFVAADGPVAKVPEARFGVFPTTQGVVFNVQF